MKAFVQNDRGGQHRSGQGAATGLIDSRNYALARRVSAEARRPDELAMGTALAKS